MELMQFSFKRNPVQNAWEKLAISASACKAAANITTERLVALLKYNGARGWESLTPFGSVRRKRTLTCSARLLGKPRDVM